MGSSHSEKDSTYSGPGPRRNGKGQYNPKEQGGFNVQRDAAWAPGEHEDMTLWFSRKTLNCDSMLNWLSGSQARSPQGDADPACVFRVS